MCLRGSLWCGRDDVPWGYNSTRLCKIVVTCVKKRVVKLPFPNEVDSKMKKMANYVMWHEKDVLFK
jgi:hypothetical protein